MFKSLPTAKKIQHAQKQFITIIVCASLCVNTFHAVGQDSVFVRQLRESQYLKKLLAVDSSAMGFTRWRKKEVIRSRVLPLASAFNELKIKGPGNLSIDKSTARTVSGSVLLETPASLAVKNPSNRSYAFAEMIRPLNNENLETYNRISVWVKLDAPGFYSAFAGVTLYNEGKKSRPHRDVSKDNTTLPSIPPDGNKSFGSCRIFIATALRESR